MEEGAPSLLIHSPHIADLGPLFAIHVTLDNLFLGMHQALRVQWRLWKKPVRRRNTQNTAYSRRQPQQHNIPSESTRLLRPITVNSTDDATDFVIEEKQDRDDQPGDYGRENPFHLQLPEPDEEDGAIRTRRLRARTYLQRLLIEITELTDVRHADEDHNTNRSSVLG